MNRIHNLRGFCRPPFWPHSVLCNWLSSFQLLSELRQKSLYAKPPLMGTGTTLTPTRPDQQWGLPRASKTVLVIGPKTVMIWPFLHTCRYPPTVVPLFPGRNLETFVASWRRSWDVSGLSPWCWPCWNKSLSCSVASRLPASDSVSR